MDNKLTSIKDFIMDVTIEKEEIKEGQDVEEYKELN